MATPPYHVAVQAYATGGDSASEVVTSTSPDYTLATPQNVTISKVGTSLRVDWDYTPGDADGLAGFKVWLSNNPTPTWGSAADNGLSNGDGATPTQAFYYQTVSSLVGPVFAVVQAYDADSGTTVSAIASLLVQASLPATVYVDGISADVNRICTGLEANPVGGTAALKLNGVNVPTVDDLAAGTGISVNVAGRTVTIAASGGTASPLTTKGDIYTYSTTGSRLPVGTNGQMLIADSSQATGIAWSNTVTDLTVTGGSMTMNNGTSNYIFMGTVSPGINPTNGHLGMRIKIYGSSGSFNQSTDSVIGSLGGGLIQWYSCPLSHQFWINGTRSLNASPNGLSVNGRLGIGPGVVDAPSSGAYCQTPSLSIDGGTTCTKILSSTATLDFPSISANSTATLTITVTGAATGNACYANPDTTIESGLVWNAYVSASNTVTVVLANVTTAAIDPASRTWRATVMAF